MRAVVRVAVFSAVLVLLIVGGLRLGQSQERLPAVLSALKQSGAELVPLGPSGLLEGWLVRRQDGSVFPVYAAPDGHAVAGLLYGADGLELTGGQVRAAAKAGAAAENRWRQAMPIPVGAAAKAGVAAETHDGASRPGAVAAGSSPVEDAVRAAAAGYAPPARSAVPERGRKVLFERALDVAAFTLGETGPDVVAFIDPACPWSRQAAAEQGSRALDGEFRLHAVPVGLLGADARAQAAGIAAAENPALAWFGSSPAAPTAEDVVRLEANNALWRAFGAEVVPWFAWRDDIGEIRVHAGRPELGFRSGDGGR